MSFLERVLHKPSYGYETNGELYVPTHGEILRECATNLNPFKTRKNWLSFFVWTATLSLGVPLTLFFTHYFSFPLLAVAFVYSMVLMGSHGTFWLHRYGTHHAFQFSNKFALFICRNLVIKTIPEEVYIVSHHVHHSFSEKPGDPYNVHAGWLYCFLADITHQPINRELSENDYARVQKMVAHTGMKVNTYAQYQRWGTLSHPLRMVFHYAANWAFWFAVFFAIGGMPLAVAIFGSASVWAVGVRTFNYDGHGGGKDKRGETDFNRKDLSVNHAWAGFVAGEWHNNHHLYPNSARCGFLKKQIDLPWYFIRFLSQVRWISSYRDYHADFMANHYLPALAKTTVTTPAANTSEVVMASTKSIATA